MPVTREQNNLLKDQTVDDALRQGVILDQLEAFRQCQQASVLGHTRGAISDVAEKNNITHGCCRAFSLLNGIMQKTGEKIWWDALLKAVKNWDGEAASLNKMINTSRRLCSDEVVIPEAELDREIEKPVLHTGPGFPQRLSLKKIFEIVHHNILFAQCHRYKHIPGNENDKQRTRDYLFTSEIKFRVPDGDYLSLTDSPSYAVGNFDLERLMRLITHENFKKALETSICLVYSSTHACRLYVDRAGKFYFYDPNFDDGKAKPFSLKTMDKEGKLIGDQLLFNRFDRSLGEGADNIAVDKPVGSRTIDLAFELVTDHEFDFDPFQGYWDGVAEQPFAYLSFKNFSPKGRKVNFASEFTMGGEAFIAKWMGLMSSHLGAMTANDRKQVCKINAKTLSGLIEAAIRSNNKPWLTDILAIIESPEPIKSSKMNEILNSVAGLNKTQRSHYEGIIRKRLKWVSRVEVNPTECAQSLYSAPPKNDPINNRKKPRQIRVVSNNF